jgi:CRISPR-associated endonuclease/helicase Cas3
VKETRWHRSERVTEEADGSLTWTGRIAEPVEMLPWIKGWGAEVEVLEPASLQATLREETARAARVYGWRVEEREK